MNPLEIQVKDYINPHTSLSFLIHTKRVKSSIHGMRIVQTYSLRFYLLAFQASLKNKAFVTWIPLSDFL